MSDWLTYSPTSGYGNGTITLTATSISELNERFETIVVSGVSAPITASTIVAQYAIPTSITFDSLSVVWVNDIPWYGGTATKSNCSYVVYANYSDGTQLDVTNATEITGELEVPPTTAETRQNVGVLTLTATFLGETSTATVDVYQYGVNQVPTADTRTYLSYQFLQDCQFTFAHNYTTQQSKIIYYSINGGEWVQIASKIEPSEWTVVNVNKGDIVRFKGYNNNYYHYNIFSSGKYNVFGNIMSLVGNNFATNTTLTTENTFGGFFNFDNISLGYNRIFDASNLILPATILTKNCYGGMFAGNIYLTTPPSLPATTLAEWCYGNMFLNCPSLTIAPNLSATTLAKGCYEQMFKGCSGLTTAPDLPATNLVEDCYRQMFLGCSNLNYIKCLATDISANHSTLYWVENISSTGTFVKNSSMSNWSTGDNGIPSGWKVQNA